MAGRAQRARRAARGSRTEVVFFAEAEGVFATATMNTRLPSAFFVSRIVNTVVPMRLENFACWQAAASLCETSQLRRASF